MRHDSDVHRENDRVVSLPRDAAGLARIEDLGAIVGERTSDLPSVNGAARCS
jgi:hypothetical protein